jgi:membrane protein DedA with SNARE-associated domain
MEYLPDILQLHYLGLFILLIAGGIGLPFPEDATLILCGVLLSAGDVKFVPAILTVYAGLLCGDTILYHIGKKFGRKVVTHKWFHRVLTPEKLEKAEARFIKHSILAILLGRHVAGLRAQLFLVSGILRMDYWKFILTDAVSAIFTMALMVGIGYKGGEELPAIREHIRAVGHVVLIVAVAAGAAYMAYRYITRKSKKANSL